MRRQKPISVKVKAPSRGLVTRLPSETADLMKQGDAQRVCTAAENVRFEDGCVRNVEGYERVAIGTSLLANMVAHWRFEEAGGTRYDSVGRNDLIEAGNTLLEDTGKIGSAVFIPLDELGLEAPTGTVPNLVLGGGSFTLTGWVKFTKFFDLSAGSGEDIVSKQLGTLDYKVYRDGNQLGVAVGDAATGLTVTQKLNSVSMSLNTWYFFAARYDDTNKFLSIRVNATNEDGANASYTAGVYAGSNAFTIGPSFGTYIDSVSIWNRRLNNSELDAVYNSGDGIDYPFLGGAFGFVFQANLIADPAEPLILGTSQNLFAADRTFTADPRTFNLSLTSLYSGGSADQEFRWSATDFFDKVVFAQKNIVPQYWVTGGVAMDLPGLAVVDSNNVTDDHYDGVFSFDGKAILWRDNKIKWSDTDDLTNWVPVAQTIASLRLTLTDGFTQPAINATTDWLAVDESLAGLTIGQYVRIDDIQSGSPFFNFYLVADVSPAGVFTATTISGGSQTVAASSTTKIVLDSAVAWKAGQRAVCGADTNILLVDSVVGNSTVVASLDAAITIVASPTTIATTLDKVYTDYAVGDFVSISLSAAPSNDVFEVMGVSVTTGPKTQLSLRRTGLGNNPAAVTATYAIGSSLVKQPLASLTKSDAGMITVTAATSITEKYAVKLTLCNFTGRTATGATIASGKQIVTLDANDAGEAFIVGNDTNGPIYQGLVLGDYAYLYKERSIHQLTAVGRQSGVFSVRTVLTNEGLIARNAFTKLANGQMCLLGHRELYLFDGGSAPKPVCMQYTRQLYDELDRTRLNDIVVFHRERRNEIWVLYPVTGGMKMLVWNYMEDTASIDRYDEILGGITAASGVDWVTDPSWEVLASTLVWETVDPTVSWAGLVGGGRERQALLATANGELLIHGNVFSRDGQAYTCFAETMDFDCSTPEDNNGDIWKYIDVVRPNFQVKTKDNQDRFVYIQVGCRSTLDGDISWTPEKAVNVKGGANPVAKVNPGGSGRYFRIRFLSRDADVIWRLSSFDVHARPGGTY